MATYYALTTTNPRGGWRVVAIATTRTRCELLARAALGTLADAVKNHDIYTESEIKNLVVMNKSVAMKRGPMTRRAIGVGELFHRDDVELLID